MTHAGAPVVITTTALIVAALGLAPGTVGHHHEPIQPGAPVQTTLGSCTLNFVFENATRTFVGTAGHCVPASPSATGHRVWDETGDPFGTVVYNGLATGGPDFALIEIDEADEGRVLPSVRTWHGPSGVASDPSPGDWTLHHGSGLGFERTEPTQARTGVLEYVTVRDGGTWWGASHPVTPGDSGAPVLLGDGRALGVATQIWLIQGSLIEGPTLAWILESLAEQGFEGVKLVTASFPAVTDRGRATDLLDHCVSELVPSCMDAT